jgi:hypothetical protein
MHIFSFFSLPAIDTTLMRLCLVYNFDVIVCAVSWFPSNVGSEIIISPFPTLDSVN